MGVYSLETPCPRTFECRLCGRQVDVTERGDRRTVFCCAAHERQFWRHRDRYEHQRGYGVVYRWQLKGGAS